MIDYSILAAAIEHYKKLNYEYVDVPWLAGYSAINRTKPANCQAMEVKSNIHSWGYLLGSAEQAFTQQMMDGTMKIGNFVACTPCFRDEACYTEATKLHFMKVELIRVRKVLNANPVAEFKNTDVLDMVTQAVRFMENYSNVLTVKTTDGFDIIDADGLELGSYGLRSLGSYRWIYGTGVAEPRLSISARNLRAYKWATTEINMAKLWANDSATGR